VRRLCVLASAIVLVAAARPARAQSSEGLAGLLLRFFSPSNPVVLAPNLANPAQSHDAHFRSQGNAQDTLRQLNAGIAAQLSTFPIGSSSGGFTYTFDFDSRQTRFDLDFESQDLRIVVDKKSHLYIDGTVVDWSYSLMDRGLKFTNPQAKGSCGCGTSFIYEPKSTGGELPVFELKL